MNTIIIKNNESTKIIIDSPMKAKKFTPPPLIKMKARRNLLSQLNNYLITSRLE